MAQGFAAGSARVRWLGRRSAALGRTMALVRDIAGRCRRVVVVGNKAWQALGGKLVLHLVEA